MTDFVLQSNTALMCAAGSPAQTVPVCINDVRVLLLARTLTIPIDSPSFGGESEAMLGSLFSRDPIAATFWLLVVIELIPALMELWREQLLDRRGNVLHRTEAPFARRTSDRTPSMTRAA
jgi:hypothetical protein